ncbi:MAG: DUF3445 domain-containing protein [Rhodospirillaceae bacterium]|nr:DUF3445 domain-containing protein [Rhodospirillaceae bacterium]
MSGTILTPAELNPLRIGLGPLEMDAWLAPRPGDAALLAERGRLAAEQPDAVLAALSEGEAAVTELAAILRGRGHAIPGADARGALAAMAGAVAEDLLLLTPAGDTYRLVAGVLCFPNRWRLTEKIGKGLAAIHTPVPEYETALASPVDRFLARLRPGRAYTRSNWGLASSPALHLPLPVAPVDPVRDSAFFLRREEQGFVKLPASEAVVFSIRTTVTPWAEIPAEHQAAIREVAGLLSPAWRDYKSLK